VKKTSLFWAVLLVVSGLFVLTGCGGNKPAATNESAKGKENVDISKLVTNDAYTDIVDMPRSRACLGFSLS